MGGWALIDNCPGPEGLCPPTPAAGRSQLQRRRPGGWLWPVGPVEPGLSPCQCGEGNSINSGASDAGKDSLGTQSEVMAGWSPSPGMDQLGPQIHHFGNKCVDGGLGLW